MVHVHMITTKSHRKILVCMKTSCTLTDERSLGRWFAYNLIKIQLFMILSYENLTAAHMRSCADDLRNFHLRELHQPIKMLHASTFESFPLSESGKLRFDWLTIKVICT